MILKWIFANDKLTKQQNCLMCDGKVHRGYDIEQVVCRTCSKEDYDFGDDSVEEKFPKENFRVNREMRDEILVYDLFLTKFWAKMVSKCAQNAGKIWILGFRC